MARTVIPVTTTSRTDSTAPTAVAGDAVNFNSSPNDGRTILVCNNTGASPYTVTVNITKKVDGVSVAGKVYTIAATTTEYIGPFPVDIYGSTLTYDVNNAAIEIIPLRVPS